MLQYVLGCICVGILESGIVDLLCEVGVVQWMDVEGLVYYGVEFLFDGQWVFVVLSELIDGKSVMVYGQIEVICDLMVVWVVSGVLIVYGVSEVVIYDVKSDWLMIIYFSEGEICCLECDFIVGCDGFYGVLW